MWIELAGANSETLKSAAGILPKKLRECFKVLSEETHTAVIHCAAGIHRTGTIAYTLLRLGGMSAKEAMSALSEMRQETAKGVGKWRIEVGEALVARSRLPKQNVDKNKSAKKDSINMEMEEIPEVENVNESTET